MKNNSINPKPTQIQYEMKFATKDDLLASILVLIDVCKHVSPRPYLK